VESITLVDGGSRGDVLEHVREGRPSETDVDPLELVEERSRALGLPAAGWIGYEYASRLERLPGSTLDDLGLPLLRFDLYADYYLRELSETWPLTEACDARHAAASGEESPARRVTSGTAGVPRNRRQRDAGGAGSGFSPQPFRALRAQWPAERYRHGVERIRRLIREGDLYQVNLTQRFRAARGPSATALFRRLLSSHPGACSALLEYPESWGLPPAAKQAGTQLLSISPELFLRRRGNRIWTRPIKGTAGRDPAGGRRNLEELLGSPKERAELAMIVDLLRNDLSRVCIPGSVEVAAFPELLVLPSLYHTCATVRGRLRAGLGLGDCIRAAFPSGSVTGCPRIRAMQRIDELEDRVRGPYTGSLGLVFPDGDFVFNVAIRTALGTAEGWLLQAGGGITVDSDPQAEYLESLEKLRAFDQVLGSGPYVCG